MLRVDDISKTYSDGTRALARVSLEVAAGEFLAIVGESGCGKTSLLRILAGLESPTTGSVAIDGVPVRGPTPVIGLVFQEPRLMPWLSVAGNIALGHQGRSVKAADGILNRLLAEVGLLDQRAKLPRDLSGGQQQRVAIARALAGDPRVLLLDEPFSALDAATKERLQFHLLDLWHAHGLTIVHVTHDLDEALRLADRILVLEKGRVPVLVENDLSRPRDSDAAAFVASRKRLREMIGRSAWRAAG